MRLSPLLQPHSNAVRFASVTLRWGFALMFAAFTTTSHAQILINEIMQNPDSVLDASGEWFEVYNAGVNAVDINGWTIRDLDTDSHVIANGGPLLVPAGGFLVLGTNADSGANGGVIVNYQYDGITIANGADELILVDTALAEIDRVAWDGGPTFPDPTGASMALTNPALDNNAKL